MEGEKLLRVPSRFESSHLPFPLAGRLMRDFGSIVGVSLHDVSHTAEDVSDGSRVASQFVGNDPQWFRALATQQFSKESLSSADPDAAEPECRSRHHPDPRRATNTAGR